MDLLTYPQPRTKEKDDDDDPEIQNPWIEAYKVVGQNSIPARVSPREEAPVITPWPEQMWMGSKESRPADRELS